MVKDGIKNEEKDCWYVCWCWWDMIKIKVWTKIINGIVYRKYKWLNVDVATIDWENNEVITWTVKTC